MWFCEKHTATPGSFSAKPYTLHPMYAEPGEMFLPAHHVRLNLDGSMQLCGSSVVAAWLIGSDWFSSFR